MIGCLIIISLAFAWLLYESDFLRVRLPMGPCCKPPTVQDMFQPFLYKDEEWPNSLIECRPFQPSLKSIKVYRVKDMFRASITRRQHDPCVGELLGDTIFSPGIFEPLCGWDWVLNREHPQVTYEMTLIAWGCKHTIIYNPDSYHGTITNKLCQIALKPNAAQRQEIRAANKEKRMLASASI